MTSAEVRAAQIKKFVDAANIPIVNFALLDTALTHTSYANEHRQKHFHDNERLEFLGDAVLDLIVGEYLFLRFPHWEEGELTRAKASAVCESALADCANALSLGVFLRLGKGEEQSGGRRRVSILADAFEAMIGAIYLDNTYEATADFVLTHLQPYLDAIDSGRYTRDYKTELQEYLQRDGDIDLVYRLEREEGPDHDKTFYMEVVYQGRALARGTGKSKKEAAQRAACTALQQLKRKA